VGEALRVASLTGTGILSPRDDFTARFKSDFTALDCPALFGERCAMGCTQGQCAPAGCTARPSGERL